jgi:hypothetical protein
MKDLSIILFLAFGTITQAAASSGKPFEDNDAMSNEQGNQLLYATRQLQEYSETVLESIFKTMRDLGANSDGEDFDRCLKTEDTYSYSEQGFSDGNSYKVTYQDFQEEQPTRYGEITRHLKLIRYRLRRAEDCFNTVEDLFEEMKNSKGRTGSDDNLAERNDEGRLTPDTQPNEELKETTTTTIISASAKKRPLEKSKDENDADVILEPLLKKAKTDER